MNEAMQIAQTIQEQLTGKTLYMLGAKNLAATGKGLSFRVRGSKKVNYIHIELNEMDLYDVTFGKIAKHSMKEVNKVEGAYVDMLHELIEENTGLYTSL